MRPALTRTALLEVMPRKNLAWPACACFHLSRFFALGFWRVVRRLLGANWRDVIKFYLSEIARCGGGGGVVSREVGRKLRGAGPIRPRAGFYLAEFRLSPVSERSRFWCAKCYVGPTRLRSVLRLAPGWPRIWFAADCVTHGGFVSALSRSWCCGVGYRVLPILLASTSSAAACSGATPLQFRAHAPA